VASNSNVKGTKVKKWNLFMLKMLLGYLSVEILMHSVDKEIFTRTSKRHICSDVAFVNSSGETSLLQDRYRINHHTA